MLWLLVSLFIVATQASYRLPLQRIERPPLPPSDVARLYEGFEHQRHPVWHGLPQVAQAPLNLGGVVGTAPLELSEQWAEMRKKLTNNMDVMYTAGFEMGTPQRTVQLLIDTGSSDLWVKAHNSAGYDVKHSPSAHVVELQYGRGEVAGDVAKDRVCVGDICVDSQYFLLALRVEDMPTTMSFDGLLGLGLPGGASVGKPAPGLAPRDSTLVPIAQGGTILERLNDQHAFGHLAFALDMYTLADKRESSITFGDAEELAAEAYAKGLGAGVRAPLVQMAVLQGKEMIWSVKVDISVSGVDPFAGDSSYMTHAIGVLDSGTTLILMPAVNYAAVMQVALGPAEGRFCKEYGFGPARGMTICDCAVPINPVTIAIPGADGSSISVVLGRDELFRPLPQNPSSRPLCLVNIMPTPRNMPILILGEAFLRHIHTIYDFDRKQVIVFAVGSKLQNALSFTGAIVVAVSISLVLSLSCVGLSAIRSKYLGLYAAEDLRRPSSSLTSPFIGV